MSLATSSAPPPPAESPWFYGARTVAQAEAEAGLSRDELFSLMASGALTWMAHGGRRTRLIAWGSLVAHLERLDAIHKAAAGPAIG